MALTLTTPATTGRPTAPEPLRPWRVMVVDDSAVIRGLLTRILEKDPDIKVVASVGNGQMAVASLERSPVDVIVLDIEMPVMDGITAIPKLLAVDKAVKIVMASTLTQRGAEVSLQAMSAGATDYIAKPTSSRDVSNSDAFGSELVAKVKALGEAACRGGSRRRLTQPGGTVGRTPYPVREFTPPPPKAVTTRALDERAKVDVIAIGSSTGGPQALFKVLAGLGRDLVQPVVITQHMPATFTTILAEHITRQTGLPCAEGRDGEELQGGRAYLAPGGHHMIFAPGPGGRAVVRITDTPPENYCRPSVDPMLRSLIALYGPRVLVAILTGMGQDGLQGSRQIVQAGGQIIAQDQATSTVWGMPGAVAEAGITSAVLPLDDIGPLLRRIAKKVAP